jgi:hypothetical protein
MTTIDRLMPRLESEADRYERSEAARDAAIKRQARMLRRMTVGDMLDEWGSVRTTLGEVAHVLHPADAGRRITLDLGAVIDALAANNVGARGAALAAERTKRILTTEEHTQ